MRTRARYISALVVAIPSIGLLALLTSTERLWASGPEHPILHETQFAADESPRIPQRQANVLPATVVEPAASPELIDPESAVTVARLDARGAAECLQSAWRERTGKSLRTRGLAVILAHWALETGRGRRMVGHNFGGIKGDHEEGGSVRLWTRERKGDVYVPVQRRFRAYPNPRTGATDYVALLQRKYPRAFRAVRDGEVEVFVSALAEGGYFTEDLDKYHRAMRSLWYEFVTTGTLEFDDAQTTPSCGERDP